MHYLPPWNDRGRRKAFSWNNRFPQTSCVHSDLCLWSHSQRNLVTSAGHPLTVLDAPQLIECSGRKGLQKWNQKAGLSRKTYSAICGGPWKEGVRFKPTGHYPSRISTPWSTFLFIISVTAYRWKVSRIKYSFCFLSWEKHICTHIYIWGEADARYYYFLSIICKCSAMNMHFFHNL